MFGAVAAEYLPIDRDPEVFFERLMQTALPFVQRVLPLENNDDKFVHAALLTEAWSWETRSRGPSQNPLPFSAFTAGFSRGTPAQVIDQLRREKGWTLEDLAYHADVGVKQVYRVKNGDRVKSDTISKLAQVLECSPSDLFPLVPVSPKRRP